MDQLVPDVQDPGGSLLPEERPDDLDAGELKVREERVKAKLDKLCKGLGVHDAYSIIILNHQPMNRRHALQSLMGLNKGLSEPVSAPRPINVGLAPFTGPWTKEHAAHLLRRTMFGPNIEQIN